MLARSCDFVPIAALARWTLQVVLGVAQQVWRNAVSSFAGQHGDSKVAGCSVLQTVCRRVQVC